MQKYNFIFNTNNFFYKIFYKNYTFNTRKIFITINTVIIIRFYFDCFIPPIEKR